MSRRVFLKKLGEMFPESTRILSKQLQDYLSKSGPLAGNTSSVYYAAYVFFEKLQLKQGKKKSKEREEMEARWKVNGGVDRKHAQQHYTYMVCGVPVLD